MELWVLVAAVVIVALYGVSVYNRLVGQKARVEEAWSDIQVQMKRRYDLVPNLVETVKGYAGHERGTLEAVVAARNAAASANGGPEAQAAAERTFLGALGKVIALAEAYPDLKANQNFLALQQSLEEIEAHINGARRFYNGSVRDLNVSIRTFPPMLIARAFGFQEAQFFELDDSEREAASQPVKVSFS
ncbi:LemA protein [Pseudoxanthobacter soli DSM 19599]|uniref:LemA protein n=1 Tax=Pseudoxanthobacter soli DSM 19599 TaxID=1123029 RepID=A0A1M7ZKG3_9HYPH|nr:LemA family protein [Pseudoxanthobacter soli]SHO65309.1 LemA protein [Pseudoxanthobacter soli DSM 19599]